MRSRAQGLGSIVHRSGRPKLACHVVEASLRNPAQDYNGTLTGAPNFFPKGCKKGVPSECLAGGPGLERLSM